MSLRRQTKKVDKAKAIAFFKKVFLGLYYRHEFARRNKRVYDAGPEIVRKLGMHPKRFGSFVQSGKFLTDDIVEQVEGSVKRTKGAMRRALGDYLHEYGVIPMMWTWGESGSFFPRSYFEEPHDNYMRCVEAFKALLWFEGYAMAVLKIRHPIMFPVMPLAMQGDNREIVVDNLMLGGVKAPMYMDYSMPQNAFDAYIGLLSLDDEVLRHREDMLMGSVPKQSKSCKPAPGAVDSEQGTGTPVHDITRLRISKLDQHLLVYDLRKPWVPGRRDKGTVECYNLIKKTSISREFITKNWGKISKAVSGRLAEAKPYVKGYRKII
mgnify:CR=1 FL=1